MVSINVYQWKSAYCLYDSSHLENFLKYVGVNKKFDFRWNWKFCWDLSNVIPGGNCSFWSDCVISGGTLYHSVNYEVPKWPKYSIIQHSYGLNTWLTPYSMLNVDFWTFNYFLYVPFYNVGNLGQFKLCHCYLNYPKALNTLKRVYFNLLVTLIKH